MEATKEGKPTVETGGGDSQAEFQRSLMACWQSIDALVLALAARYDLMVILSALAEHTGTGLQTLMQCSTGGAPQALHLISRMESNAFTSDTKGARP